MEIVVSDTTALINLARGDLLFLLDNLFSIIYVPEAVFNELMVKKDLVSLRIKRCKKLKIKKVKDQNILKEVQSNRLDRGEIEAIALALELDVRLIIDEKKGRSIAKKYGLNIVGVLGLLVQNYKKSYISYEDVLYYVEVIEENGLRISKELKSFFIEKLKEINSKS